MRQKTGRHFPFAAVGLVLMAVSVAPTVVALLRSFGQMRHGGDASVVNSGVALAFHPALIACGVVGMVLIAVGIVLALRRARRPVV